MAANLPGVLCLEGEWDRDIEDRQSVRPILEVLEGQRILRQAYHSVRTREELQYYIDLWIEQGTSYDILYLTSHGTTDGFNLSEGSPPLSLASLAAMLEEACGGAVIHLGACSVMNRRGPDLQRFLDTTGARYVCGYASDVDWVDSAAYDLILLANLAKYAKQPLRAFRRMEETDLRQFGKELDFRYFPPPKRSRR